MFQILYFPDYLNYEMTILFPFIWKKLNKFQKAGMQVQ